MFHVASAQNAADCLTKYLPYPKFWPLIAPVLYWKGETNQAPKCATANWGVTTGARVQEQSVLVQSQLGLDAG